MNRFVRLWVVHKRFVYCVCHLTNEWKTSEVSESNESFEWMIQWITNFCSWIDQSQISDDLRLSEQIICANNSTNHLFCCWTVCLDESFAWMIQWIIHFVAEQISMFKWTICVNDSKNHSFSYWTDQCVWVNDLMNHSFHYWIRVFEWIVWLSD